MVVRFRRSSGVERQQLKWFTFAAIPEISFVVASGFVNFSDVVGFLGGVLLAPLLPIAAGLAILRYRLYEIDRIVSRTISYATVTGILAVVFVGAIVGLQALLAQATSGQTIPVAASTLAVLALFQPLMRRVRRAVDRRFDRARYDADRTAQSFAERLRDEVDLTAVTSDLSQTTRASPRSVGARRVDPRAEARDEDRVAGRSGCAPRAPSTCSCWRVLAAAFAVPVVGILLAVEAAETIGLGQFDFVFFIAVVADSRRHVGHRGCRHPVADAGQPHRVGHGPRRSAPDERVHCLADLDRPRSRGRCRRRRACQPVGNRRLCCPRSP